MHGPRFVVKFRVGQYPAGDRFSCWRYLKGRTAFDSAVRKLELLFQKYVVEVNLNRLFDSGNIACHNYTGPEKMFGVTV
jgi:hypothetical protein